MEKQYVEVIIDIPKVDLGRGFHYQLPQSMRERAQIGSLVLVPFRRRKALGYVVGFPREPEVAGVKEVSRLLDEPPLFDWGSYTLSRWISTYYQSTPASALHLVCPPGRGRRLSQDVILDLDREDALRLVSLSEKIQGDIVEFLAASGGKAEAKAIHDYLSSHTPKELKAALDSLEKSGIVSLHTRLKEPAVQGKSRLAVTMVGDIDSGEGENPLDSLTAKQRSVMECLARGGGSELRSELLKTTGTGASTIKSLEAKGLIKTEPVEILRVPRMGSGSEHPKPRLTVEQELAVNSIYRTLGNDESNVYLLEGVTGSGKTEVYLRCIEECLGLDLGALMLIPEISLTPQMLERFQGRFPGKVAVLHSRLSPGERYDQWRSIRDGKYQVVLGARSAVFAPLTSLGLIAIDEEQESAYKSQVAPRYHARDVALRRARSTGADVILGSATPSFESLYHAKIGKYSHLLLTRRVDNRPLPEIEVVDMRKEAGGGRVPLISSALLYSLVATLEQGEQAIILLNRRGYSNYLQCHACGHIPGCEDCDVTLCYHRQGNILLCHHCNRAWRVPKACHVCGEKSLKGFGAGTQQVEEELLSAIPGLSVVRMDTDTTRGKNAHWDLLDEFKSKKAEVLLGTQMIAKGLDIPDVTMVGVVNADTALALPDFRAAERTYQLLTQVSGRAGRGNKPGKVVIQTYNPDHPAIMAAASQDPSSFLDRALRSRREALYPPFVKLVNILVSSTDNRLSSRAAAGMKKILENRLRPLGVAVLGPAPAPLVRIKGLYRWHILLKCPDFDQVRKELRAGVAEFHDYQRRFRKEGERVRLTTDVDPVSLL